MKQFIYIPVVPTIVDRPESGKPIFVDMSPGLIKASVIDMVNPVKDSEGYSIITIGMDTDKPQELLVHNSFEEIQSYLLTLSNVKFK